MNESFIKIAGDFAKQGTAFFFLIDFEKKKPVICRLEDAEKNGYWYCVSGKSNCISLPAAIPPDCRIVPTPISKERYVYAFKIVLDNINKGNSYLLNLTFPTKLESNLDLPTIFRNATAKYKLYNQDFTLFSPECFIKIIDGYIYSYPMKGTIDASIANAEETILNDKKETWEHNTIVDLIRNDLSIVATEIEVSKFRYIEKIKTHKNELLQVSSEIKGKLPVNWKENLGQILMDLLPAGSISGAPKEKTVEIIRQAEGQDRNYFTGVFGVFDGQNLDSAVNIRFIEQTAEGLQFRSGGGITAMSKENEEYNEMIEKVYVPIT